ncbi:hypothetical protein SVIOM74S_04614 [Streptomyces violarus]
MADPKGFMTTPRQEWPRRPVEERVRDWDEVYVPGALLPIISKQADRCMDCGIPFCHEACPLGNLIPEWNDLVSREDWRAAADRLHATNNFPEFTGRLCPAPCEAGCVLAINQPAVTIKNVECAIADRAWEEGFAPSRPPDRLSGKTVAVIGSGPTGLAAAQQLTRAGHTVAVYERDDRLGGLMRYGIPAFKMEKHHLERRLEHLGTVLRVEQNPVARLHGPYVLPHRDDLGPGQPPADRRRGDQDAAAGTPLALAGVLPHEYAVVQHPDGQLVGDWVLCSFLLALTP